MSKNLEKRISQSRRKKERTALEMLAGYLRVWLQPELRIRIAALSPLAGQGAPGAARCSRDRHRLGGQENEQMGIVRWAARLISVPPPPPQHPDAHQQCSCQGKSKGLEGLKTTFEQSSRSQRAGRTWTEGGS